MLDVNVAFAVKALGTGFWCLCYFVMVLQGLTTGDAVFSPWPHKSMAYCIVWEALFSWAKPKTSSGEVVKASKAQAEMTRILFLAWMILDIPLMLLFLWGGNGIPGEVVSESRLHFLIELVVSFAIHYVCLRWGGVETFWFVKYLSIPYDIYISYTIYEVMALRGPTASIFDVAVAVCKLLADFFYLLPMIALWQDIMPKHRNLATYAKGAFVIVFAIGTYASNVTLLHWVLLRSPYFKPFVTISQFALV